jgi:riboflavin kinase/FMN adenylyltransferase
MKAIVVGEDYSFGKNREGNIALLKTYAPRYGFEVIVADWIRMSKAYADRISSTKIRQLVTNGLMEQAEKMLGRYYQIRGQVVTGRDRGGKLLGIPTANINLHDELCPKIGIYAVTGECRGKPYKGVANIGYSPTFENHEFTVEVHIFDFDDDIYGEKILVNFIKRIRDEVKFSNISDLIDQIKKDIAAAREILSA